MGTKVAFIVVLLVFAACGADDASQSVVAGSGGTSVSVGAADVRGAEPAGTGVTVGEPIVSVPVEVEPADQADPGLSIKDAVVAVDGTETTVSFVPVAESVDIGSVDVRLVTLEGVLFVEVDYARVHFPNEAVFKELWLGEKLRSRTSINNGVGGSRMESIGGLAPPIRILLTNEDFETLAETPEVRFDPEHVVGAEERG